MNLPRLLRTVAPLKPIQIYGRLVFRLNRPKADLRPAPSLRAVTGAWTAPIERPQSLLGPTRCRFLNLEADVSDARHWNDPARDKLWLYNLHYFDDLGGPDRDDFRVWRSDLVDRWIAENPPGQGNGWEPYTLSLRIVNWIKWALQGEVLDGARRDSLAVQVRWLAARLEWHLLGNHLFANAKALVFAGLFFSGPEADAWLRKGLQILGKEMPEQVMPDGGHFERSPMYHAIIFEDLLDLINLAAAYGRGDGAPFLGWRAVAGQMERWAAAMTHPDGDISFFNDAAFGIAPRLAALSDYASRLDLPRPKEEPRDLTILAATGYLRAEAGDATLLVDAGAVGPEYLPGHAHADTLSFELSIGMERLIVNSGTSTYNPGPQREADRATAAHSTVEIGGFSSSEVWSSFRVGRRARVVELQADRKDDAVEISAAHDGYRYLPGRPIHRRTWRLEPARLVVRDTAPGGLARFHLAPGVSFVGDAGNGGVLTLPGGRTVQCRANRQLTVHQSRFYAGFGHSLPNLVLQAQVMDGLEIQFLWMSPSVIPTA